MDRDRRHLGVRASRGKETFFRSRPREKIYKQEGIEERLCACRLQRAYEINRECKLGPSSMGKPIETARSPVPLKNPENVAWSSGIVWLCSVRFPSLEQSLKTQIQQTTENNAVGGGAGADELRHGSYLHCTPKPEGQ